MRLLAAAVGLLISSMLTPATARAEPESRWSSGRRTEALSGAAAFGVGYTLAALIFIEPAIATDHGADPLQNAGEKRLAFIPLAGPLLWWGTAYARVHERALNDPCYTGAGCRGGSGAGIDQGFHFALGLPYAVIATIGQAAGVGALLHAALRSNPPPAASASPKPGPVVTVSWAPTIGGLAMAGTF